MSKSLKQLRDSLASKGGASNNGNSLQDLKQLLRDLNNIRNNTLPNDSGGNYSGVLCNGHTSLSEPTRLSLQDIWDIGSNLKQLQCSSHFIGNPICQSRVSIVCSCNSVTVGYCGSRIGGLCTTNTEICSTRTASCSCVSRTTCSCYNESSCLWDFNCSCACDARLILCDCDSRACCASRTTCEGYVADYNVCTCNIYDYCASRITSGCTCNNVNNCECNSRTACECNERCRCNSVTYYE